MDTDTVHLTSAVQSEDTTAREAARPMHPHDCAGCVFLGRYASTNSDYPGHFDLYYHAGHSSATETVVARFGDDGAYFSGMDFAQPYTDVAGVKRDGIAPLVEAKRRAELRAATGASA